MKNLIHILALSLWFTGALYCQPAFGWKPSPHGIKATAVEKHPAYKAAPLPAAASVAQYFFPTDQGNRGACVAFSTWECSSAVHEKQTGKRWLLSPLDIYQQCLVRDGSFPNDNGTYGGTAIAVMLQSGALLESTWPYSRRLDVTPVKTSSVLTERAANRAVKAYAVPNDDNGFAVRQCIANLKVPVMMGSYWYANGFNATKVRVRTKDAFGKDVTVDRYVLPMPKGRPEGGHEIPIIEYDDNATNPDGSKGMVRIHNHWRNGDGSVWGDSIGSAWIPYKWAFNPRICEDKHCIELTK